MRTFVFTVVVVLILTGCGSGTNKRVLTRPGTYDEMIGFPATGNRLDIRALEAEYPELKGIVVTAPEYIEEYEKLRNMLLSQGKDIVEFRIPRGANMEIKVVGETELSENYYVAPHGSIDFPLIKEVKVAGHTVEEVRTDMEERLKKFFLRPEVLIKVTSLPNMMVSNANGIYNIGTGQSIYVFGAVNGRAYGGLPYTGDETIISVLSSYGLPSTAEWRQIRVIRRSGEDPLRKSRVIIIDLWDFFAHADVRQNIPLMPGDVVYVPTKLSLGDHLAKDWSLIKGYIGDIFYVDDLRDKFGSDGPLRD